VKYGNEEEDETGKGLGRLKETSRNPDRGGEVGGETTVTNRYRERPRLQGRKLVWIQTCVIRRRENGSFFL